MLLKWLETPHVKQWYDQDIKWTEELIKNRYKNYTQGYKILNLKDGITIKKPIYAFIIEFDGIPIGYIQYYNKHDFPSHHGYDPSTLLQSCAGVDWYIGELDYTGKGIGPQVLECFLKNFVLKDFESVFVDPEIDNLNAIKAYEKVGFTKIKEVDEVIWMILSRMVGPAGFEPATTPL